MIVAGVLLASTTPPPPSPGGRPPRRPENAKPPAPPMMIGPEPITRTLRISAGGIERGAAVRGLGMAGGRDHRHPLLEEVHGIERSRPALGMILHRDDRQAPVAESFDGAVVEVAV